MFSPLFLASVTPTIFQLMLCHHYGLVMQYGPDKLLISPLNSLCLGHPQIKIVSCPPAGWAKKGLLELFFSSFEKKTFPPLHSSLNKLKLGKKKKKNPDLPTGSFFPPPGPQETIFYLRVALWKYISFSVVLEHVMYR